MNKGIYFLESIEEQIKTLDGIPIERMKAFLDKGDAIVFMGVMHIPGIQRQLLDDGYKVETTEMVC